MDLLYKSFRWLALVCVLWLLSLLLTAAVIGAATIVLAALRPQRPAHGPGGVGVMPIGGFVDLVIFSLVMFGISAPLTGVLVTLLYQRRGTKSP
jgi:hypothetical protein